MQITDHQQLHAAEWFVVSAMAAHYRVYGIEHIGPHHADFIDHQQIQALDDANFFLAETQLALVFALVGIAARNEGAEGELEKGVQCHTARIESGHTGGGGDHHALDRVFFKGLQKGGLARTGVSGKKNVHARILDEFTGKFQLGIAGR